MSFEVIGLDLSLTRTGIASLNTESGAILSRALKTTKRGHDRLEYLRASIALATDGHDLAGVEGPSFGSKGQGFHDNAGFHWIIRHELWKLRIPVVIIPPTTLKKFATTKGNATKDQVHYAARLQWRDNLVKTDDEADAMWLAEIAARVAGRPTFQLPENTERWSPVNSLRIQQP